MRDRDREKKKKRQRETETERERERQRQREKVTPRDAGMEAIEIRASCQQVRRWPVALWRKVCHGA